MNNNINKFLKFGIPISLGYNCFFKKFLREIFCVNNQTNFFDYIGTPMWSIVELFTNDFMNISNIEDYKNIKLLEDEENIILTNIKYYLRFTHDLDINSTKKDILNFIQKYSRRKERLYNILQNTNQIIFLRYEENLEKRIIYDQFKEKYYLNEYEYIKKFLITIKNKFPKLNVKIIFFTRNFDHIANNENNILSINIKDYEPITWNDCTNIFYKIFNDKFEEIYNFLEK